MTNVTIDTTKLTTNEKELLTAFARIILARKERTTAYYESEEIPGVSAKSTLRSPYREAMAAIYRMYNESGYDWKHNQEKTLAATNGKCAKCGEPAIITHHKGYDSWALGDSELLDLEPLCRHCHTVEHARKDVVVPFFAQRFQEVCFPKQGKIDAIWDALNKSFSW